jgi:hypothetical protein
LSSKIEEHSQLLYKGLKDLGEKTRIHHRVENLRLAIDRLKSEKRRLVIEISQNQNNRVVFDLIAESIEEIKAETMQKEVELKDLLRSREAKDDGTPKRNNTTPDSARLAN